MSSWWLLWMACMFMFLVPPIGYGWGYRGWGPPMPRYVQKRRGARAFASGAPSSFDHYSWSWGGDLLWLVFIVGMVWAIGGFWWR